MKISEDIGNAAVEEDGTGGFLSHSVRAHLPGEHQLGEERPILPWQRSTCNGHLILNDASARLDRADVTAGAESFEQRGFSGSGSAGYDVEPFVMGGLVLVHFVTISFWMCGRVKRDSDRLVMNGHVTR